MREAIITHRRPFVVLAHLLIWTGALASSILLRFEFEFPRAFLRFAWELLLMTLAIRTVVYWRFGLFHGLWRYSGARDLLSLLQATTFSSIGIAALWAFFQTGTFPRSILVLDFAFTILMVGGVRFGIRTLREVFLQTGRNGPESGAQRRRLLVLGAGDAGEMLMREITRIYSHRYEPVGFLDDSRAKQNERIHNVPVLGPISDVGLLVKRQRIDEVILAIPSMSGKEIRRIVDLCAATGATLRTLPGVDSLIDGRVNVSQLAEVAIDDLLGRAPVTLDTDAIEATLEGRSVLVTGVGGSIGSELCRQICRFLPKKLVLVEQAENNLFEVERMLRREFPDVQLSPQIADICDSRRLEFIFATERPAAVFHAAAHKHVPMMESNPGEAIKNNVFGTKKVADMADRFGAEIFVMVSTDKAVNPTSVMGVSKRTAEIYVQALAQRSKTKYVTVRFGNVLGSAGSVIPIFKQQIATGGPVTITHPDMTRYFMTIPEASQLVLQGTTIAHGGEILILDMGEPVKIVDLARDLIRLSGYTPDEDIAIQFTGIRPGEKLYEELSCDAERAAKTRHPKIFVGTSRPHRWEDVQRALQRLHSLTDGSSPELIRNAFRELVPEYNTPELARRVPSETETTLTPGSAILTQDRRSVTAL